MKNNKILLSIVIILMTVVNVTAFSDDFDDLTFNAWTGSQYSTISSNVDWSLDGTPFATALGGNSMTMWKYTSESAAYWEFSGRTGTITPENNIQFKFKYDNSSSYCMVVLRDEYIHTLGYGKCAGLSNINKNQYINNNWIKIGITDSGNTLIISAVYAKNNTNIFTSSISDIYDSSSNGSIFITQGATVATYSSLGLDNVYTSFVPPTLDNSIEWGSETYVKDDSGSYSWKIKDSDWTDSYLWIPYEFRAEIYKNDVKDKSIGLGAQTGIQYYTFTDTGNYKIELMKYYNAYYYLGLGGTIIANHSITVRPQGDSYLYLPPFVSTGVSTALNFSYGMTNPVTVANMIKVSYFNGVAFETENTYYVNSVCGGICNTGQMYQTNVLFERDGLYKIDLYGTRTGILASIQTTAIFAERLPAVNLSSSFINTTKSIYFIDEYADISYGVDGNNFSNYPIYLILFNQDMETDTNIYSISNPLSSKDFLFRTAKQLSSEWLVIPGANQWQLWTYYSANTTKNQMISHKNITITNINLNGYGLSVKSKGCVNEDIVIKTILPESMYYAHLIISDGMNTISDIKLNGSKTVTYRFKNAGGYSISIQKDGVIESSSSIEIDNCIAPLTSTETETQNNNILSALLLIVIATIGTAYYTSKKGANPVLPSLVAGFSVMAGVTQIGLLPVWIIFSVILLIIVLIAYKLSGFMK